MPIDLPDLLRHCAPNIARITMERLVGVESGGQPLALHVNGAARQPPAQASVEAAAAVARSYIVAGYSVDLGLGQVNSRNLSFLGYTIEEALEPCPNLAGAARILSGSYQTAAEQMGPGQPALRASLSAYNTGNFQAGFLNGYVARYYLPLPVPALPTASLDAHHPTSPTGVPARASPPRPISPYRADTLVRWDETPTKWTD